MEKVYNVAYATGSRADYGIVRNYLMNLRHDSRIDLSILVTGTHLEYKYGHSIDNIISDGFKISFEAELRIDNETNWGILTAMASAIEQFGKYFENQKYHLLIILGDRYEMMAVAIAAAIQRIPILHLHGGETTFGNYDEFIRHSITKMSTYHFTSTKIYRDRVIQLGENPENVFYMGALGAENCRMIDESKVTSWIRNMPIKKYFVVAFHPETLSGVDLLWQVKQILGAIENFNEPVDYIFIGTNADTASDKVREAWVRYARFHENAHYVENLNVDSYLYALKQSIALIGNSSSGIIEAPSLGIYTINIGNRQGGRVRGNTVIDIPCEKLKLKHSMKKVYASYENLDDISNPYEVRCTAKNYYMKTMELLEKRECGCKEFYDIQQLTYS